MSGPYAVYVLAAYGLSFGALGLMAAIGWRTFRKSYRDSRERLMPRDAKAMDAKVRDAKVRGVSKSET